MSFGCFTKMDCFILDSSLLAIEKLGIVTKPGEARTSFIFAQGFSFLPALAELFCALRLSQNCSGRAQQTLAQNCGDFLKVRALGLCLSGFGVCLSRFGVWRFPLQVYHLAKHSFELMATLQTKNEIYFFF